MELIIGNKYIATNGINKIIAYNSNIDDTPIPAGSLCTLLEVNGELANVLFVSGQKVTVAIHELSELPDRVDMVQKLVDNLGDNKKYLNDGDHSFDELYYHRMTLFAILCDDYKDNAWKSWKHHDGSMYQDYFIVGLSTPDGDYSYHYHKTYWNKFNVPEIVAAPEWDGHEPSDINRLFSLLHDTSKIDPWVLNEIKIACVSDSDDDNMCRYMNSVYNSAAKAYMSLAKDGHSGMSIGVTKSVLNRLIDHKPLTPLTGSDKEWGDIMDRHDPEYVQYQNTRCSAVFKKVYTDGTIEYSDVDQFVCENINNSSDRYHAGYIFRLIKHLYPITMPYSPSNRPIVVYTDEYLYDVNNGDFDTVGIFYLKDLDDKEVPLNIYLAEKNNEMVVITKEEYLERKRSCVSNGGCKFNE